MANPIHHDWQKIVIELIDAGVSVPQQAEYCGCSKGYIQKIKEGRLIGDMGHTVGSMLLDMHRYHVRVKPAKGE